MSPAIVGHTIIAAVIGAIAVGHGAGGVDSSGMLVEFL
jgi:hypothetical protein